MMTPHCDICGIAEEDEHTCPSGFVTEMAEQTGVPLEEWAGKCHGISMLVAPLVNGRVQRGYFLGDKDPDAFFGKSPIFQQHSWVELPNGNVLDPTRHAFVGGDPMLWTGPADDYDKGGCITQGPAGPPPSPWGDGEDDDGEPSDIVLDLCSVHYFADLLGVRVDGILASTGSEDEDEFSGEEGWIMVNRKQAHWLAHLPIFSREGPGILNDFFAAELFDALAKAGERALIPIDRWTWIMGEED